MTDLKQRLTGRLKSDIEDVIKTATIDIFDQLFGCKIKSITKEVPENKDIVMSYVVLSQGLDQIIFRLVFEKDFIFSLMKSVYNLNTPDEVGLEYYEDTACELTNMIGNRVKAFINKNGLTLLIDTPALGAFPSAAPHDTGLDISTLSFSRDVQPTIDDSILMANLRHA